MERAAGRCGGSRPTTAAEPSARCAGAPGRPSSCCSTAARRTRTPGTPSRSRSSGRSSRSTSPGTGTPRTATTTRTGRPRTRPRSRTARARARARRARRRRHVARRPHRARARRPRARSRAPARARRRDAGREPREVVGDRAVHRRTGVLRDRSTRSSTARSRSTRRAASRRCAAASCTTRSRRPTAGGGGATTCRVAVAAKAKTARSCPASTSCGTRSSASRCRSSFVRGGMSPVVDDDDVAELLRRKPAAAVIVVDGAGHSVQGDKPLELARDSQGRALRSPRARTASGFVRRDPRRLARAGRARARARVLSLGRRTSGSARRPGASARRCSATASGCASTASSSCTSIPGRARASGITTLGAAAQFVGVPLGRRSRGVHAGDSVRHRMLRSRRPRRRARVLADWIRARRGAARRPARRPTPRTSSTTPQIWPEHFDLACELGDADAGTRANYGASPGDSAIAQPYLYVGPWDASRRTGMLAALPVRARRSPTSELRRAATRRAPGTEFFRKARR